jgi:hypothetical protein
MAASVDNYFIGKGILSFDLGGTGTYRDLGNAPEVEFTPELEELDHFSSRTGVRSKDRTIILEKSATLRMVLEEWSPENLMLALLGSEDDTIGGLYHIFTENAIEGAVKLTGSNEIGPKYELIFPNVSIIPSGSLGFITDEWGQIELNANVLVGEGGAFGTFEDLDYESPEA